MLHHHEHADLHSAAELIPPQGPESSPARRLVAGWVLGAGLAALALAFPQERLIGQQLHRELGDWGGIPDPSAWILERGGESVAFVVAALAFGACLPVCLSIARRAEHSFGVSLAVSLAVLLSPVAWLAGTTPGAAALGLLAMLLLWRSIWMKERPPILVVTALWCLASWCTPVAVWLLPAVAWAVGAAGDDRRRGRIAGLAVLGLGVLFALPIALASSTFARATVFGGSGGWGQIVAWGFGWLPALGVAGVATAVLFLLKRHESEERPPRWLLVWCLLPLAAVALGGSPTWEICYLWILPLALIAGLDVLARLEGRLTALVAPAAIALQVALLLGVVAFLARTDPLAEWRRVATETLEPGDLVLTTRGDHEYLLWRRWGLKTCRVDGRSYEALVDYPWHAYARAMSARGGRLVFDSDVEEGRWPDFAPLVEQLEAEGPLVRLTVER